MSIPTSLKLTDWPKPEIDAACSSRHGRYAAELALHYTSYFEKNPELRGSHPYSAKDLETALPHGGEGLARLLPAARRHRHYRSGKSSQVLALGLLGSAAERDPGLTWLSAALECEIGAVKTPPVFEHSVPRTLLQEEPRVTEIDFFVETPETVVCTEVKWSERGLGACSCSREEDEPGEAAGCSDGDGEPVIGECSTRVLARPEYWRAAREIFGLPARRPDAYCPISTLYQAIRNVAAARALAAGRRAIFLLIHDEQNPYFTAGGAWPGWPALLTANIAGSPGFSFRAISWQRLVGLLPLPESATVWAREKHRLPV